MEFISTDKVLARYISDMCAAEQHLSWSVKIQLEDGFLQRHREAYEAVRRIDAVAESHLSALASLSESFDATIRASFKEALATLSGTAVALAAKLRVHLISKMLRDDYVALNLNAIGYTMLYTSGLAVGSKETAHLALTHLKNTTPLIMNLSQLVVPLVVEELGGTTRIDPTVTPHALHNVGEAWGLKS